MDAELCGSCVVGSETLLTFSHATLNSQESSYPQATEALIWPDLERLGTSYREQRLFRLWICQRAYSPDEGAAVSVRMNGKYLELIFRAQKGNRQEVVPIAPEFADFLMATPEAKRKGRVFRPMAVQTGSTGPMGEDWAGKIIRRIGKRAGVIVHRGKRKGEPYVKHASAHDLRRSFATRWAPRVMPATLQKLMRHRTIATTLAYYVDQANEAIGDELRAAS